MIRNEVEGGERRWQNTIRNEVEGGERWQNTSARKKLVRNLTFTGMNERNKAYGNGRSSIHTKILRAQIVFCPSATPPKLVRRRHERGAAQRRIFDCRAAYQLRRDEWALGEVLSVWNTHPARAPSPRHT